MSADIFSKDQLADLKKIKDDQNFVDLSEAIVEDVYFIERNGPYSASRIKEIYSKLRRVQKVLDMLSEDEREILNRQARLCVPDSAIRSLSSSTWDEIDQEAQRRFPNENRGDAIKSLYTDYVQVIVDGIDQLSLEKGATRLQYIADEALYLFHLYNISPSISERSKFVNYLQILLDAAGLHKHSAWDLAKNTRKRVVNFY